MWERQSQDVHLTKNEYLSKKILTTSVDQLVRLEI